MSARVQLIDQALLDRTLERAMSSPRGRITHDFHQSRAENPHRFLNALTRGTYCAPHRHAAPPKSESFLALRGEVAFFLFDDEGAIREAHVLGRGNLLGIDVAPGAFHTVATLTDTAVCYEVKPGPYDPANDKEFASWAPREGDPLAADYLQRLLATLA